MSWRLFTQLLFSRAGIGAAATITIWSWLSCRDLGIWNLEESPDTEAETAALEKEKSEQETSSRKLLQEWVNDGMKWFEVKSVYGSIHLERDADIFVCQSDTSETILSNASSIRTQGKKWKFVFARVNGANFGNWLLLMDPVFRAVNMLPRMTIMVCIEDTFVGKALYETMAARLAG